MTHKKISELPSGGDIQTTDELIVHRAGDNNKVTLPAIFTPELEAQINAIPAIAAGSTLGLEQALLANAGTGLLAVGYTNTGKVMGVSLGAGNVIEVYANGSDYNAGNVLYREFMNLGEPICFTGLSNGAIITSTQGFYGYSEQHQSNNESPMPLLSYGLAFKSTFLYAFRDSNEFGQQASDRGFVHVVNGPLDNVVKLTFGDGTTVQGQEGIALTPWQHYTLETDGNAEYILEGTQNMMACIHAAMSNANGLTGSNGFRDSRLIMPLTNDGITWPRSGFVSAPYDNTQVDFWVRDGAKGRLNSNAGTGVSPGSPIDFDAPIGTGTGASDQDYEPDGATRVKAVGLISAYSGADSAGVEASPLMPTSAMAQIVAQPMFIADNGDGGNSGISIASPYAGTAKIYSYNAVTGGLDLEYTVPLTRNGVTVSSQDDQNHPAAGQVANETVNGAVSLVGQLGPGVIIADVPITVIVQSGQELGAETLRSQNGTTTTNPIHDDDETLVLGWTPDTLKAEITEGQDGLLYRRSITGGAESWDVA